MTLNYKLTDKKKFKPFLSKQAKKKYFKKEIGSIQEPIIYEKTDPQYVLNLQEQIRDYIAMKIEEHRAESEDRLAMATTWVRDKKTREMIDKLLTVLEEFSYTQRSGGLSGEVSPEVLKNAQKEIRKIQKVRITPPNPTQDCPKYVSNGQKHLRVPPEHALRRQREDLARSKEHEHPQFQLRKVRIRPRRRYKTIR